MGCIYQYRLAKKDELRLKQKWLTKILHDYFLVIFL